MKRDKILVFILIIIIILLLVLIVKQLNGNKKETIIDENIEVITEEQRNLQPVKNYPAFFTVQLCVERYISYVINNDAESVLAVLDEGYIQKNNINKNNVFDKIDKIETEAEFHAEKMYCEEIDESTVKYYVLGNLEEINENDMDALEIVDTSLLGDVNFEVSIDYDNMIFSIKPMENGGIFNEENH